VRATPIADTLRRAPCGCDFRRARLSIFVHALRSGTWIQALDLPELGRPLLERRNLAAAADDILREAARARLATGDAQRAIDLASRLVTANPLDDDAQELLIRLGGPPTSRPPGGAWQLQSQAMDGLEIAHRRLHSQHLSGPPLADPDAVVAHFGAMQARRCTPARHGRPAVRPGRARRLRAC
jgi:hypothetical protein